MSADDADGAAPAVQIFCASKDQPIRKTKKMSNQVGILKEFDIFIILERDQDKNGPVLHIGPAPDGPAVSGWIRKSNKSGLLIKAIADGEESPSHPLATVDETGDGVPDSDADAAAGVGAHGKSPKKHKKHKSKDEEHARKRKNNKAGKAPSIDVRQQAAAEAEVQAVRQRKADKDAEEAEIAAAAEVIAKIAQSVHRGNIDREALGVQAGLKQKEGPKEKLHVFEKAKLSIFVAANICTGLFGLFCAYSVYTMRLADAEVQAAGGSNTSAQLMFAIVFGLFLCSAVGIYGAVYVHLGYLRFYAFFLMILICAQLSTLMCLVLEVNEGASAQLETSASAQLKLDTATALQEQYCHLKETLETAADFIGVNATDANSQATCLGQYQIDSTDTKTDDFLLVCPALPINATCGPGYTGLPGGCTYCGYDQGCNGRLKNGPVVGCAAIGMVDCGGSCIPAYAISDSYCTAEFSKAFAAAASRTLEEVEVDEVMCPAECKYATRIYNTLEFNITELNSATDGFDVSTMSIWGGDDSHSMCDCDPTQSTQEEQDQFMTCMHAFYLKNLGIVIVVITAVICTEIALAVFGWGILRPWAMRRLDKLAVRPNNHNQRSKNWGIVASFALPETEEDVVRKETAIVTDTWYFEGTVIGVVTLSMYVLAKTSPTVPPPEDEVLTLRILEVFVTVFLTMELFLEIVVTISVKRYDAYIRNPWHWVDYFVLVVSWMYLLDPENQLIAVGRALRVVRPMRSVRIFSSIKLIGDCLKEDSGIFFDVTTFTLLMILTFSLVGLTCYHGALQYTCGIPVNPLCPHELSGKCSDTNETYIFDAGDIVQLRTPREAWMQEQFPKSGVETIWGLQDEGDTTLRLVNEGLLAPHPGVDYLLTGTVTVELPTLEQLRGVYGKDFEEKLPQEGIPCPSTINCGPVKDPDSPGWWQSGTEQPASRCFKLNPPRVLTEDNSGRRGFDHMGEGFITFMVSMSGDGGMEQIPTGLTNAGATTAYYAWIFFFITSIVLNFVTLNLLLAMCVATLEGVNDEFSKIEKDKAKAKRLQAHAMQVKKKRLGMLIPKPVPTLPGGATIPGSDMVNNAVGNSVEKVDQVIGDTYDKLLEGLEDFEQQRTEMEEALQQLDWTGKPLGTIRNDCKIFVMSPYYRNGVVVMVLGWTATLMFKTGVASQANLTPALTEQLIQNFNDLEFALLMGFILEIVLKFMGIGAALFKRNQECILDVVFLLVTCLAFSTSYFGFTIEYGCEASVLAQENAALVGLDTGNATTGAVDPIEHEAAVVACVEGVISTDTRQTFAMLRVAQIARMLYKHESIYSVMQKIFKNWKAILGILLFVVFSMAMFSIVGMHLLGKGLGYATPFENSGLCCIDPAPGSDQTGTLYFRSNFETFWDAMLSTVQIILGDDWALIMLWYMNNSAIDGYAAIFFTAAFLWVFGVLFNLFVAVLLINFGVDEDDKIPKQKENFWRDREAKEKERKRSAKKQDTHSDILAEALKADAMQEESVAPPKTTSAKIHKGDIDLVKALELDMNPAHKSLFLFRSNGRFRVEAAKIETHPWFVRGLIILIFVSMVVLAMENEERLETWKDFTKFMEYTVWGYFVAEMVLKSISSGFILKSGPSAPYLGHQRGRNDFAFVVVAALTQVPSVNTYLYDEYEIENRHLRILRGLGPMVGLLQSHGIRGVMHSFYSCLPGVATVMVPMIFVLIMFALLGFELYNGLLRRCECPPPNVNATTGGDRVEGMDWCNNEGAAVSCSTNVTYFEGDDCFGYGSEWSDLIPIENRTGCDLRGYQWSNDVQTGSFDDVITAAITLFKASTTGATDLLYVAMDAASVKDELPSRNNTPGAAVFLTVFHTVFTMFLLNIFIGVMSSTFSIQTGKAIETDGEKRWNQLLKDVGRFKPTHSAEEQFRPDDPDSRWYEYQMKAFEVATHYAFSTMCVFMVLGNTILLVTEHYPASTEYIYYTELLNLGFITWFAIEFIVKLAGFGLRNYFSDGWLIFDFIIISSTWAIKVSSSNAAGMDLFKVARCMKIFLLAKRLHSLVELMHVVGACITQAANVAVIMLVITYIYAIMGMKVYGAATLLPQTNFRDFQHAMKLLIQVMTGQSYGKIISLLMAEGADTGGPYSEYGGLAFFVTYYILSVFICANLFIVTVLDNFDVASRSGQVIKPDEFWGFTYAWGELTVGAHAVPVLEGSQVMDFVKKLRKVVDKAKEELDVPTVSIKVKNIPNDHARPEIISEKFSKYGEIENIEIRPHYPLSGAFVTYHDKTKFDEDRCFKDEIIIGLRDGEPCRVEVGFTRHGDFPHGIIAISLPDSKRLDRGTMQIDITRGDGIKNGIQPYVQVTSVAKHLHHGGKNVSKITRSINRNSMVEDALGLPSMIVIAPPGAQKFQYCKQIAKRYGLVHIDVGEMLRAEEADKILSAEQERKEQAEQEGTHGRKSPGKLLNHETVRENWFISQEEENAERDAEQAARERAAGDTTPDSTGALTPGRIRKGMSRNEKRKSMGVSTSTAPEDHLKGLRSHVEHHPALHSGKLVGDKHVLPLVRARIAAAEENDQGFILSGFPRTKRQAHQLKAMGAIPGAVVVLDVESDECHRGCRERKIDPKTGRVYDMLLNPPKRSEVQARVVSRRDDHDPKVIETRLKRYADHADETIDALDKITAKDAVFRLQVDDPSETLADMMGLMEVTFGDATHYNADATPSAPVPAEWDGDDPLCFHVNEHTRRYEFKLFDAAAFNLEPLGSFSIDLQPMIEMAHFIEDREVDWSDDNLDDLLTLKSLNPINAMATMNKTLKEAEKLTKLAVQEAEKAKNFAIESAAMAAEMALETVGVESTLMQGLAEDGAKTHALEFKNDKDEVTCTLMCQLRFHTREWVPDWNFISEFGDDNKFLKPHSSGIEGWVERKEGFKSGKWEGKWMFITEHPPQLCILDVANEQELRSVMKGKQGKVPEETITRILPHEIHQLRNGFTRRRQKSKKSKAKFAKDEDCQFEFTTLDEIDHSKVGLHDGTKSPGRRNGVLHVQVVEAKGLPHMDVKGDTDGYVVLELEGVQHKTAVVEDTIDPSWDESCSFSVFDKASPLMISIFDEDPHSNDDIIGKITLDVSELLEDQPKEVWSEIKQAKGGPAKIMFSGGKSGPGALGQLKLVLNWADAENSEVLLQRWTEDDILNNRLRVQSAQWRFRVASPEVKYSWLQAIAWVERGCDGPRPPMIAVPSICDEDMKRVENDPSTVDLPIAKCRHLLYNLRQFDCLGLKEGRDATLYATFQLELHAWKKVYQKDRRKKITGAGASVDSFHGLDFKLTLQRLCLLRYGKAQSLSYHQMMDEYEHEKAHIALHMIQTCLLAWIYRRRGTYTGTDKRRAVHAMWKKGHMPEGEVAQCYFSAIRGVRNIRFEALSHLGRLVNKQNPDIHHGSWDPSKVKQTREEKKRAKKEASAEAKRLAKEQREQEFNEKHDRDQQAQLALANDALQVRRSGRHGGNQTFENPVLYSGSEEEDDDGVGDNGVMSGHLAPRTELQMRKMSSSSFEDESVVPASFEDETTPRSLFDNDDSGSGRASPTREKGNIWSSDEDD